MDQVGGRKVALVHDFLFTFGGAERVLQQLHRLYPEAPIHTMFASAELVGQHFPQARLVTSPLQRSWLRRWPSLLLGSMPQAVESFDLSGFDLVISSSGAFSHGAVTGPGTRHLCYCHSPMRYAWDYHARYLEERGVGSLGRAYARLLLHRLRLWDFLAAGRVDHWMANSRTVAARIEKFYRQPSTVISPPVDTTFFTRQEGERDEGYALSVSRLSANKRVRLMIEACARLNLPLRVAGEGSERPALERLARRLKAPVTFLGRLSEEEKRSALARARCFLFAAEDDFGIAPLEALACGTPVVALGRGGATEYVRPGENGYLFPEPTAESLADCLAAFLRDGVSLSPEQLRQTALPYAEEEFRQSVSRFVESHA